MGRGDSSGPFCEISRGRFAWHGCSGLEETGKPVVMPNHVDRMRYVEGYEPSESKPKVDPRVGREM